MLPPGHSAYDFNVVGTHKDYSPMPSHIPTVDEVGATSDPLTSASFFLGAYCRAYYEDFMLCKAENNDPEHCLKEGRKVTRCSIEL